MAATKTTKKTAKKAAAKPKAKAAAKTPTFSPNKKLNYVLSEIYKSLKEYGQENIDYHKKNFPREPDYEIAQCGALLVYFNDIRDLYKKAGYAGAEKWSNDKVWQIYLRQVGYVAREYFK